MANLYSIECKVRLLLMFSSFQGNIFLVFARPFLKVRHQSKSTLEYLNVTYKSKTTIQLQRLDISLHHID